MTNIKDNNDSKTRKCNAPVQTFSRVVGFYTPINQWNKGKREEFDDRAVYDMPSKRKLNSMKKDIVKQAS